VNLEEEGTRQKVSAFSYFKFSPKRESEMAMLKGRMKEGHLDKLACIRMLFSVKFIEMKAKI
jgi:hypothetical protein